MIKPQAGFSLVGMLVAVGLLAANLLMAVQLLSAMGTANRNEDIATQCESGVRQFLSRFKDAAARGVDVRLSAGSLDSTASAGPGYVRPYQYDQLSDSPPAGPGAHLLAIFPRESARSVVASSLPGLRGTISRTALFFQPPTATTPGAVYLDLGRDADTAVAPDLNDVFASCLTEFYVENQRMASDGRVLSTDLRMVMRRFTEGGEQLRWCPRADMTSAGCTGGRAFNDISFVRTFFFANNKLTTVVNPSFQYPFGVYLFSTTNR